MAAESLTPALDETLAVFGESREPRTTTEVADRLDLGRRSTYERLDRLVERDRLDTKKVGAGGRVWWLPTAAARPSADAAAAHGDGVVDIDERELMRQMLEITPASVFVLDREGGVVMGNERFRERVRSLGANEAFDIGDIEMYDTAGDRIPHDERPHATVCRTGEALTGWHCQVALASGQRRWVSLDAAPLTDADGAVEAVVVAVEDTTRQRSRTERALEQSNRQLETLVENFPNGAVAFVDEDLRYATVGGTPVEDAGVTTSQLRGERIADKLPPGVAADIVPKYEAALEGEPQCFEREHDGRTRQFHMVPVRDGDGAVFGAIGMSQDITERTQYERGLEQRIRQLETITDLGTRALQDRDLDALIAEVVEQTASVLGVEYCKVLDLTPETDELLLRQGVGWDDGIVGSATVSAVEDDSQAAYTLKVDHPVVVTDLDTESRFSGPDLLRTHDVSSGISVIIGPYDDPWGILGTHDTDEREFTDQDINFVQSVANILANAIERATTERELVTQREQLATLNSLNGIVHGITDAVIERSTREEIERTVCEHLVETGSYSGAWIADGGDVPGPDTVRASAGTTTPQTPGEESPDEREGEPIAIPEAASSLAIPIGHEGMRYGVLHVQSERGSAFDQDEAAVLGRLGEVVGHAIAASERKHALMSERVVEVHYRVDDVLLPFDIEDGDGHITFDQSIDAGDGEFLLYGTATAAAIPTLERLVSAVSHWRELSIRESDDEVTFELRVTEPPVLSVVASMGGSIESAVIDGGSFDMTVHVTPGTDVRTLTETVRDTYPDARLVSRRQRPRPDETLGALERVLDTDLTDRQRLVLTAAYHAGYFEWPREASGDDIADSLGVSAPTFHQHLRKVEGRLFEALLSSSPVTR